MRKLLIIFSIIFYPYWSIGQIPFSYQLGEKDGLPINRVYDIHVSQEGFLFAGTSRGLVKYDGKKFEQILSGDPSLNITQFNELKGGGLYFISFRGELYCYQHDSIRVVHKFEQAYPTLDKLSENRLIFNGLNGYFTYAENDTKPEFKALPLKDTAGSNKKSVLLGRINNGVLIRCQNELFVVDSMLNSRKIVCANNQKERFNTFRSAFFFNKRNYFFGFDYKTGDGIIYSIADDSLRREKRYPEIKQSNFQNVLLKKNKLFILTKSGYRILSSDLRLEDKVYEQDKYISELIRIGNTQILSTTTNGIWITPDRTIRSGSNIIPHKLVPFLHNYKNTLYYSTYEGDFYSCFPNKHFKNIKLPREARVQTDFSGNYFSFSSTINHHLQLENKELRVADLMFSYGRVSWIKELDMYLVCGKKNYGLVTNNPSTAQWIKSSFKVVKEDEPSFFKNPSRARKSTFYRLNEARATQALFQRADSSLWVATGEKLYHYLPGKSAQIVNGKNGTLKIFGLLPLTDGTIIVNTDDGLYKLKEDSLIGMLTTAQGLDVKQVRGLKLVNDTFIYFGNSSIHLYNEKNGFFKTFSSHTNLPDGEILNATLRKGNIYIGTRGGLFVAPVTPNKMSKPKVYIRYLMAGKERWPKDVKIPFDQNDLVFKINGLDLLNRGAFHYEYRLSSSKDTNWIEQDASFNTIRFTSLSEGDYTLKVKVVSDLGQQSDIASYNFKIQPPFIRSWPFYLLCFLVALGIGGLIFYIRTQAIRRKSEFDKQVKQSEITAIKAQMNPHFVFNALNAIQNWVITKDVENSNLYLGKFSDLVRKTLEASEKNALPLHKEIEIIQLYLDLENLRFGDKIEIDFAINISQERQEDIFIPAMLIQPYIENVFKHGLLHKKGDKELQVLFEEREGKFYCEIKDNGVGREKAKRLGKRSKKHKSFSTQANRKRIDLLNEIYNDEIRLEISDVYPDQEDAGTIIQLWLPIVDYDLQTEDDDSQDE